MQLHMIEGRAVIINFTFRHACVPEQAAPTPVYQVKHIVQCLNGHVLLHIKKRRRFNSRLNGGFTVPSDIRILDARSESDMRRLRRAMLMSLPKRANVLLTAIDCGLFLIKYYI